MANMGKRHRTTAIGHLAEHRPMKLKKTIFQIYFKVVRHEIRVKEGNVNCHKKKKNTVMESPGMKALQGTVKIVRRTFEF